MCQQTACPSRPLASGFRALSACLHGARAERGRSKCSVGDSRFEARHQARPANHCRLPSNAVDCESVFSNAKLDSLILKFGPLSCLFNKTFYAETAIRWLSLHSWCIKLVLSFRFHRIRPKGTRSRHLRSAHCRVGSVESVCLDTTRLGPTS